MNQKTIEGISITDYGGAADALIFIHAFPLSAKMWDKQVTHFRELYRVITYDVRGLGESINIPSFQFTMEEHVNDLLMIMDHLGIEKAHVCGLSMGGYILQRAILKNPGRFHSAVLCDTKSESDNNESLLARSNEIIKIKNGGIAEFYENMAKKLLSERSYSNPDIKNLVHGLMETSKEEGVIASLLSIATRTNSFYLLKDVDIPCHMIVGRQDVITTTVRMFFMRENIPNSSMTVIEECGHLPNIEKPEEFNSDLERFLRTLN